MPRCRICERENPSSAQRCEGCGAWLDAPPDGRADVPGLPSDSASPVVSPAAASPAILDPSEAGIVKLLRDGRKIEAIKQLRSTTGVGLKEAKDAVEAIGRRHGIVPKPSGCGAAILVVFLLAGAAIAAGALALSAVAQGNAGGQREVFVADGKPAGDEKKAPSRAARLVAERRVLVIAHRGDSKAAPENTLSAFRSALKVGVDLVELDYHHTADGVPVVLHDATLERTTDAAARWNEAKPPIAAKRFAELAELDAGSWFGQEFAGAKLTTLAEAIETIRPGAVTLVERKAGDAATVIRQIQASDRLGDVVVQAFDWEYLAACRKLSADVVLGALGRDEITSERLDQAVACRAAFIGWADKDITPQAIALAHARGLRVYVFTVNEQKRAEQLIDLGADGLITDVPATIKDVVARKKKAS